MKKPRRSDYRGRVKLNASVPDFVALRLRRQAVAAGISLHALCVRVLARYACRDEVLRLAELPEEQRLDALLLGLDWDEREPLEVGE